MRRSPVVVVVAALAASLLAGSCHPSAPSVSHTLPPHHPEKDHVEVLFVGDLSVARDIAAATDKAGKGDVAWPFADIKATLAPMDLVFANLEVVLTDSEKDKAPKTFNISAPTKYDAAIHDVGIDVVSVANNHALDYSFQGFWSTLNETKKLGLGVTGVKESAAKPQEPLIVQVGKVKMGFLAYNAYGDEWKVPDKYPRPELYKIKSVIADVKRVKPTVDQLVVSIHWGPELSHEPWDWQVKDAHAIIDAGADFLIGQHPHVPQQVEEYKNGIIAYSLGDFLFDKRDAFLRHRTGARFFLQVGFDGKKRTSFKLLPINHDRYWRPHPEPEQDTASWIFHEDTSSWIASKELDHAVVKRIAEDEKKTESVCGEWTTKRPRLRAGYMRWIEHRWMCADDEKKPGDSVGRSAELASTVMRTGVWASPNNDTVHVEWKDVPLKDKVTGYFGWPDWVVENEHTKKKPVLEAAHMTVHAGDVVLEQDVPFEKGWKDFTIDTSKLAGQKVTVSVDVQGKKRDEPGFIVELKVP